MLHVAAVWKRMKCTKRKNAKSLKIGDCFYCCCEKIERNKEEKCQSNRLEDTFHCLPRSFHPPPVPADQTHFQKNILIRRESSSTKRNLQKRKKKIFIRKQTCWRHMPLNSAILPLRWLKENKFINNSSNVIFYILWIFLSKRENNELGYSRPVVQFCLVEQTSERFQFCFFAFRRILLLFDVWKWEKPSFCDKTLVSWKWY